MKNQGWDRESIEIYEDIIDPKSSVSILGDATLDQFELLRLIGRGAFGKVFLIQNLVNKKLYAMKCIRNDLILEAGQLENTRMEKEILQKVSHPFLIDMDYVFQDQSRIYFIMPFIKGGMLFTHL